MSTEIASNECSICKHGARSYCTGCKQFFCIKDYNKHRKQLATDFESDVIKAYDELREQVDQIDQTEESHDSADDLFVQIDQWEETTIEKVRQAADKVRQDLTQMIASEKETLTKEFESLTAEIRLRQEEEDFAEDIVKDLQQRINELRDSYEDLGRSSEKQMMIVENDQIDWNRMIYVHEHRRRLASVHISPNAKWTQNGVTVAGGNGEGNAVEQLYYPRGIYIDDDKNVLIADEWNHRVVEWKHGATSGQVVAGGNGAGNQNNQLNCPSGVIVDKQTNGLIICDKENQRVVRWPRRGGTSGSTVISDIASYGLTMDDDGFLYVCDYKKHEVRRWRMGETQGTLVAGGNGRGNRLDQLNGPISIFVDRDRSVYVSDDSNYRVMKWMKDAKQGIVVAGGQGPGNALTQLSIPVVVIVDHLSAVYVADYWNDRIMRWNKGATQGSVVVGGNGRGGEANQLNGPRGLSFDLDGNLYVVDRHNNRVQKFSIEIH